ncbi:MAG: ImmA/IrrE family metallo-endopeptidase [Planctomycetaceae bacterium]|nr:ImmA/IrrE family metallo-endopeptidase [Planctomycetaceae bacterium]
MAKRFTAAPANKLRFMKDQEFEDEASLLLAEYGNKHGQVTATPVPVDEMVELYLGLSLEFLDMQKLFGVSDVHGALWVNEKRVGIDQRLDPGKNPAMLGRYHFTLAHEAGHWRLHRQLFLRRANQHSLFTEGKERPEYICRSSDTEPIEFQANRFASCLMMPREMLKRAWHEWRNRMDPIYLPDLRAEVGNGGTDEMVLENTVRPLATTFQVSPEAMRIRAEGMGLLVRKKEASLF